ncbi:IPTL-CTERM sorting domain-containing protein [Pseudomonas paralcaligenes]|uniref:IPTL-CTERM sorting domain-containing protein n=1 Tax=Pseudomonas paralcaligenes TaxID=2772558 RepID=UPI001C812A00|nr:IPTL-CTERM sorting domain-containing protein [Pseudomonas paralcaligenes]
MIRPTLKPPSRSWTECSRGRALQLSLAACLVAGLLGAGHAGAVGSRSLYPQGYLSGESGYDAVLNANAGRALMNFSGNTYGGVIRARTFIYVYAQAGERILLGRDSNGTATVYTPDTDFGPKGNEAPTGGTATNCAISSGTGRINTRAAELAGPGTAAGVTTGSQYVPCVYQVTQSGIHGVLMEAGGTQLDRWEVTVRASDTSTADLPGRVFTYAFAAQTLGNNNDPSTGTPRRLYSTFHYVTQDGYRYRQQMKGLDPNAFAIYANARGFLDADEPLYKNVRGSNDYLASIDAGVTLEAPAYPIFFEDISGTQADDTLTELGIPLVPPEPMIDNVAFSYPPGGTSHSYVGRGGVISFDATDVMSYQIVISAGGDYDVANPLNRVLEGSAVAGRNEVLWDGLANNGSPVPANAGGTPYNFQVVGRNGEAHFPLLDAEKNFNGGPVITQLNGLGSGSTTIYYDDRAYKTRAGVEVGTIAADGTPEHLCGGTLSSRHVTTPVEALNGVDSASTAGFGTTSNGAPRYPRYWGGNGSNGSSTCSLTTEFADKLGLDLWVLQKSDPEQPSMGILIYSSADVTTRVSAPSSVAPGATVVTQIEFGNVGSSTATGVSYGANLPTGLSGVSCSGATCSYNPATGAVTISGLPPTLTSGQWVPPVTLSYTAPASGSTLLQSSIATTSPQEPNPGHAPDSASAPTAAGGGASVADVMASVSAPVQAVAGQTVSVPVSFRNFGPLDAVDVAYVVQLPAGTAGVSCGAPATCGAPDASGQMVVTFPSGTTLVAGQEQSFVLTYTAPSVGSTVPVSARVTTTTDEGGSTANNNASGMTTVIDSGAALADVTVSISPPASAVAGQTVNVPVVFENKGPNEANGVSYTVSIPPGLTDVTCAPAVCSASGGTITWTGPATLGNGQRFNASFSYTAPSTGPVNHTATIGTSSSENNAGNNTAAASTSITAPDMRVDLGGLTPPAEGVPYNGSFTCSNIGSSPAVDNTLCSVTGLPPSLSQGACTLAPGGAPWNAGDAVPVGGVVTCAVTGTPGAPSGPTTVTGNTDTDDDADPSNNQATVSLTVRSTAAAPTLSGWALILLSGLLALIGHRTRRQGGGLAR